MKRAFALLSGLLLLSVPTAHAQQMRPPVSTIALQLNAGLPSVGDFALRDRQGKVFALGRMLVDFASVYEALATGGTAKGVCEFVHVPYEDGKRGLVGVRQMRYWFHFDGSVVHLNTDSEGSELRLEFEFDPTKECVEGVLKKGIGESGDVVGTCRVRLKDAPQPAETVAPAQGK